MIEILSYLNFNVSWENFKEGYKTEMGLCSSLLWDAHFPPSWIALWAVIEKNIYSFSSLKHFPFFVSFR